MNTKIYKNIPGDGLDGLNRHWRSVAMSGFLIALPLCLAISKASGFSPIAGIHPATIDLILISFLMGARVTIKGPAAGIVAVAMDNIKQPCTGDNIKSYQLTSAVITNATIIQILFGLFKSGKFRDYFPASDMGACSFNLKSL